MAKQVRNQAPEEKLGYNLLLHNAADLDVSQDAVNKILRYYTDTLGWSMNQALLYTLELFENGTIAEVKSWGRTEVNGNGTKQ